jgi:hypothetical protein
MQIFRLINFQYPAADAYTVIDFRQKVEKDKTHK